MTRRWGKAGQRLTDAQIAERDRRAVQARLAAQAAERGWQEQARTRWEAGLVIPDRITAALDLCELYGPEVDRACGVQEPAVDLWEAGRLYPSLDQLAALARLTGFRPVWFTLPPKYRIRWWETSLRYHLPMPPGYVPPPPEGQPALFDVPQPDPYGSADPVLRFTPQALAEAVERWGIRPDPRSLRVLTTPDIPANIPPST